MFDKLTISPNVSVVWCMNKQPQAGKTVNMTSYAYLMKGVMGVLNQVLIRAGFLESADVLFLCLNWIELRLSEAHLQLCMCKQYVPGFIKNLIRDKARTWLRFSPVSWVK